MKRRYALVPMALLPPALAAALLYPAALDPIAPLAVLPAGAWLLFFVAAAAPAAAVATARAAIPDRAERNRALVESAAAGLVAAIVTVALALLFADPLLVRGGAARVLLTLAVALAALAAGGVAAFPRERFVWGLVGGEVIFSAVTLLAFSGPSAPDDWLREAMRIAPGWGSTSLAALAVRDLGQRRLAPRYEATLRALDAKLDALVQQGAFAPPFYDRWADDVTLERGWMRFKIAASPDLAKDARDAELRAASDFYLRFAANPKAEIEPFTRGGVLGLGLREDVEGLEAPPLVLDRVAIAWRALDVYDDAVSDPEKQIAAEKVLRDLFVANKLDLTDPVYLATYTMDRRRLVEAGDAQAFLDFFDGLASGSWPDPLKAAFARESSFVRAHPEDGYKPVMALLHARVTRDRDLARARTEYAAIIDDYPGTSVAELAKGDLQSLDASHP